MAKYYNNKVKTGRLAGSVFAVRYGEVIERAYNPVVANPKSENQVIARAKLKLLSQLSAVMADVIAMPREGAVSPRNLFVKYNYGKVSYANNEPTIQLSTISLTRSVLGLPQMVVSRADTNVLIGLASSSQSQFDRVVYAVFNKTADNELRYISSQVISDPGDNNNFTAQFNNLASLNLVIYAYGVRDNNSRASVAFGNLTVPTAEAVAKLIVSRELTFDDVTLTETRGLVSNVE